MAHHPNGLKADYTIATVSVTLVLLLLGAVGYILLNAYSSTSAVRSELRFSLLLSDTVTHAQRAAIERRMGLHPAIASWRYLSADEAAQDFQAYIGADFVEFLGENPLPASYELTLNAGHTDPSDLTALERECTTWSGVEEVAYQQKIIDAVTRNLNRLNYILLGLGIFLLAVAIMLISNTLRLAVAARRQAIATMKLVGATTAFIRRPFVWRSFTQGVVAGVLSSLLLYLFADGLSEVMPDIRLSTDRSTLALLFSGMILVGVTICTTFTALAVNRFVRHTD
ncbi:permease-like cell division protein FtsX [uncultured Rikenella sp.]|uniref:cell division protein FtsX n=1 Tax=uncultured Rikenella sp. TaxID=368003 RepID=UPI002608D123|nr:permease-like cell division protein FtsX [uncultured Rikenella sp.]